MANAPTRPPNHPGRRTQRGPRVSTRNLRPRLVTAAQTLSTAGHDDLADAVTEILAPDGWRYLRGAIGTEMFIRLPVSHKKTLVSLRGQGHDLNAEANTGLQAYLDGEFAPASPKHGKAGEKTESLRLTPAPDLMQQAREKGEPTGLVPSQIIRAWFQERFGLATDEPSPRTDRQAHVPRDVRDAAREAARESGKTLGQWFDEGWQAFLDGDFTPPGPDGKVRWPDTGADLVQLKVRTSDELYRQAEQAGQDRAGELGFRARAMQVGLAYVLDKLNIAH